MPSSLENIKKRLDERIGSKLTITSQAGRKKVTRRHGVLVKTFPRVFIIELDDSAVKTVSFTYTDILTKSIELNFDDYFGDEE
ncbi:Veg family protein [Ligilactobacillus saerimneri]